MVALIDHAGHELWDVEKQKRGPKTDAGWREVEHHAIQLAAAGPLISLGGAGARDATWAQTPSWRTHAQKMSTAALAAVDAAKAKNFESLVKANGQLVDACEGCHKEFKPDIPSEGITHGH
jgi:cytochrome c556